MSRWHFPAGSVAKTSTSGGTDSIPGPTKKKENIHCSHWIFIQHQMWKTMKLDEFYVTEHG